MSTHCPYCLTVNEINHDDGYGYDEDTKHNQECIRCEKTFIFTTLISISYRIKKADCLNGAEHDYKETKTYPARFTRLKCSVCDDEKPLPAGHPFLSEATS